MSLSSQNIDKHFLERKKKLENQDQIRDSNKNIYTTLRTYIYSSDNIA